MNTPAVKVLQREHKESSSVLTYIFIKAYIQNIW